MRRESGLRQFCAFILLLPSLVLAAPASAEPAAHAEPWVLVDVNALTLTVLSERNQVLARFKDVSIGRGGYSADRRRGDHKTPLGTYRVVWINSHSRFKLFFGLDWPAPKAAERAYLKGDLPLADYQAVMKAFREHRLPPQDTALGGGIGIHGLGSGSASVHQTFNWTDGCIALTNESVTALRRWLQLGTRVVIR